MARFQNTISYSVDTTDAYTARQHADEVIRVGEDHGYFRHSAVVSVEAVAVPIYTQAQYDAAIAAAVALAQVRTTA
jgi:hypothetical protein